MRQCESIFSCSLSADNLKMMTILKLMLSNLALLEYKKNDSYFFERSTSFSSYGIAIIHAFVNIEDLTQE